jgi:hypothetical protein
MSLWESVQKGLDKASKEAARIARTQKLRSQIDGMNRQIITQHDALIRRTMDLFLNGALQQPELLPLCQEIINLQQQVVQAQNELQQVQQGAPNQPGELPVTPPPTYQTPSMLTPPPPPYSGGLTPPPPNYETIAATIPTPPPPPDMPATIMASEMSTQAPPPPGLRCPACQAEIMPDVPFCHACGNYLQGTGALQQPTMRSSSVIDEAGTVRAEEVEGETVRAPKPAPADPVTGAQPAEASKTDESAAEGA